jgi:hypothetical protein
VLPELDGNTEFETPRAVWLRTGVENGVFIQDTRHPEAAIPAWGGAA